MMIMYNIYFFLFKVLMVLKTHNHNNILFLFRTIFHFKAKKYISSFWCQNKAHSTTLIRNNAFFV